MMGLQTKTFQVIVADQAAAVQGAGAGLIDFSVGSILRAIAEAVALVALWLQAQIIQVLRATRAATSAGADLDSWVGDFGLTRTAATRAIGEVELRRFSSGAAITVAPGALVRSSDGARSFEVIADAANPAFDTGAGVYRLASGGLSVTVSARASTPGAEGNVVAGAVTVIASSMPGIDTASNPEPFVGGSAAETDDALRARFIAFLASLSRATRGAVAYAIDTVRPGLSYTIIDAKTPNGLSRAAFFTVVVDDGTGTPSPSLIADITAAIDAVRPLGVAFGVTGPHLVDTHVSLVVEAAPTYSPVATKAAVRAAIAAHVTALGVGQPLRLTRLAQIAYDAAPGAIANVTGILINGAAADLVPTFVQRVRAISIQVS